MVQLKGVKAWHLVSPWLFQAFKKRVVEIHNTEHSEEAQTDYGTTTKEYTVTYRRRGHRAGVKWWLISRPRSGGFSNSAGCHLKRRA